MNDLNYMRPCWAEIDLDAIKNNIQEVRRITSSNTLVTGVIKANAYQHGAIDVAKVLLENGADRLAVAFIDEALELRQHGIDAPLLILGNTEAQRAQEIVEKDIQQTVFTYELAKALSDEATKQQKEAKIHIKVDSGMGRIGFLPEEASLDTIEEILALPNLVFEGLFTHFATADDADKTYSQEQFKRYTFIKEGLEKRGLKANINHVANSAATLDMPDYHLDMVRAGVILYGVWPSNEVQKDRISLKPAMSLKCRVVNVKSLDDQESISYGRTYFTKGVKKIATLPLGYADGFTRLLSNKTEVLIKGKRAPIVGNICMDQCMIDVSDIPDVHIGDEVVIFGQQGHDTISVDDIAAILGTIGYEVLCMTHRRVPRVYLQNGQIDHTLNYLLDV